MRSAFVKSLLKQYVIFIPNLEQCSFRQKKTFLGHRSITMTLYGNLSQNTLIHFSYTQF